MFINVLILICNIIVLRMAGPHGVRMSDTFRRTIFGCLGRCLCCKYKTNPHSSFKIQNPIDKPNTSVTNHTTGSWASRNNNPAINTKRPGADPNPDLHTPSKEDKQLSLSLARTDHPLAEHPVNASLGMPQEEAMQEEWQQAARILDRFFGICCFMLMVFLLFGVYFLFT